VWRGGVPMSERFFISGVQMGLIRYAVHGCKCEKKVHELMAEVEDKQFIGNMPEPYKDYEIVIVKKGGKRKRMTFTASGGKKDRSVSFYAKTQPEIVKQDKRKKNGKK
jgi:hypothetical protein